MRGAGRTKGPVTRDYGYRPPRKVRLAAMRAALSLFQQEGRLFVLDAFPVSEPPKTRAVAEVLKRFEAVRGVICDGKANESLRLASRNLPKVQFFPPEGLNVYDLLKADRLLVTRVGVDALSRALKPAKTTRAAKTAAAAAPKKA